MGDYKVFCYLVGKPCRGGTGSLVRGRREDPRGRGWVQACQDGVAEAAGQVSENAYAATPPQGQAHLAQEWGQTAFWAPGRPVLWHWRPEPALKSKSSTQTTFHLLLQQGFTQRVESRC